MAELLKDGTVARQVWAAYNHNPGGQIVVIHFEDYELEKRGREDTTDIIKFLAVDQARNFSKAPYVRLNLNGNIEDNKILIYEGEPRDLRGMKNAADIVIEWAKKQGLKPIYTPEEEFNMKKKIGGDETRISHLEAELTQTRQQLDKVLLLLSSKTEGTQNEVSK